MDLVNLSRCFVASMFTLGIAGGILGLGSRPASAQAIIVSTPFSFFVDNQPYPAGTYEFILISQWLLSIQNTGGGDKKLFPIRPQDMRQLGSHGGLAFYSCEGHRKLQAVHVPGTDITVVLLGAEKPPNVIGTHTARPSGIPCK
jgi:hypothetical protein